MRNDLFLTALVLLAPAAAAQSFGDVEVITSPAALALKTNAPTPTPGGPGAALASLGSDVCATPDPITGLGPHQFDNSSATTGTEGQLTTNCIFFNQIAITNDVWFSWTAPSTGQVRLSDCGTTTVDTKVAVYNGPACPGAGVALGCNDDISLGSLQSKVYFNATAGNTYLIQVGTFPGDGGANPPAPGGTGSFSLEYAPFAPQGPCRYDDGTPDVVISYGPQPGTGMAWFQRFGAPGDSTAVSGINVAYGAAFMPTQGTPNGATNGMPVIVGLWDDPNDDNNPNDAVLIEQVNTTVMMVDTDTLVNVPLTMTHQVAGVYFIGASITRPNPSPANFLPFSMDLDGCGAEPNLNWVSFNNMMPYNVANLAANTNPPVALDSFNLLQFIGSFLLRPDCMTASAGMAYCAGDGLDPNVTAPCPCANFGSQGHGCASSFNGMGAQIAATGVPGLDNVVLQGSGMNANGFCIFLKGAANAPGGLVFGDGVRCADGTLIRLRSVALTAGTAEFPNSAETVTLSQRGQTPVGSGLTGYYTVYYRNAAAAFCPPATFNAANGWQTTW